MGIKTTAFRRIAIYVIEHAECRNEVGLLEPLGPTTVIKAIEVYPNDTAVVHIIDEQGYKRKLNCKLKD